ncbi:DUF1648 domain-containing protein [Microbacterium arabinogalactanolyticum]|uniref:DUF1648 domain-containing protein n=1 Tax=Microbacterium arabinogalactanolyticum TaxID=69365 RepID=UPI002553F5B8|nr:DUF1648 domain-containing protein [Microbacterium arabinogalactanolyticum]GLC85095.1 hypothetical protein MIAR_16820 [Microbacterium arabinogalactanolyticum]
MTDRSTEQSVTAQHASDLRRARRMLVTIGLLGPVVITAVVVVLIIGWLPSLPDPAATHWGVGGVDRLGSPTMYLWLAIGVGLGLPVLIVAMVLAMGRTQWGGASRLLGGMALGLSALSAVINGGSVALQRGLSEAAQVGPIWPVVVGGFCALLVLTAVGWVLQPDVRPTPAKPLEPAHLASISAGERVVWMATASMPRVAMLIIGFIVVLVVGITAVMVFEAHEAFWIPLLTLVIIGFAFATSASFRVRAGADGLTVRSQVGFPQVHVPLDEIVSVRAVECHPFGEFGGFGWRVGMDGRTGIVLRTGPAIEVERRDKRPLVVTVDGAEVGAATLQAYLDRRAESS